MMRAIITMGLVSFAVLQKHVSIWEINTGLNTKVLNLVRYAGRVDRIGGNAAFQDKDQDRPCTGNLKKSRKSRNRLDNINLPVLQN